MWSYYKLTIEKYLLDLDMRIIWIELMIEIWFGLKLMHVLDYFIWRDRVFIDFETNFTIIVEYIYSMFVKKQTEIDFAWSI